jgi:hypothetical protein
MSPYNSKDIKALSNIILGSHIRHFLLYQEREGNERNEILDAVVQVLAYL